MDVMAGKVQRNQPLEDDCPSGECGREKDEEARCGAPVGYHVEDRAEGGGLVVPAGSEAVGGI